MTHGPGTHGPRMDQGVGLDTFHSPKWTIELWNIENLGLYYNSLIDLFYSAALLLFVLRFVYNINRIQLINLAGFTYIWGTQYTPIFI